MEATASLDTSIHTCSCCGKSNLMRAIKVKFDKVGEMHLGVVCAGKHFDLNLSGNPYKAAAKLERYLSSIDEEDFYSIIDGFEQ